MADFNLSDTWPNYETVWQNANAGGIGKPIPTTTTFDALLFSGFALSGGGVGGNPYGSTNPAMGSFSSATRGFQISSDAALGGAISFRTTNSGVGGFTSWQEIYHTGNTGIVLFDESITIGQREVSLGRSAGQNNQSSVSNTTEDVHWAFFNPNGEVGSIKTNGTATSFNTSSDNRLKAVIGKPTDADIDAKFNDIFDAFTLFDWKNGGNAQPVWGFLAHDVIDKGLDFGSEGEGPRSLNIGDKYEDAVLDQDGNEVEPAKFVSPAGVDQSKVVPYLVAKIEQLERRLKALEA